MRNWWKHLLTAQYLRRGLKRLAKDAPESALRLVEKAHSLLPSTETRYSLVLVNMSLARYGDAEALLKELPPAIFADPTAALVYGECLLRQRKWEDLGNWIAELQEKYPQRPELISWMALARDPVRRERYVISREFSTQAQRCVDARRFPEALKLLEDALQLTPERAELHNNLGSVKLSMGVPAREVYPHFEQAVKLDPGNRHYQQNLAYVRRKR